MREINWGNYKLTERGTFRFAEHHTTCNPNSLISKKSKFLFCYNQCFIFYSSIPIRRHHIKFAKNTKLYDRLFIMNEFYGELTSYPLCLSGTFEAKTYRIRHPIVRN